MTKHLLRSACRLLLLLLPALAFGQGLNDGLLLHYPLDGTAVDVSGNDLDGVLTGGVTPATDRFGNAAGAMAFDGAGYIELPGAAALKPQPPLSLSFWVNFEQIASGGQAILTTDFVEGRLFGVTVGLDNGNRVQVSLGDGQTESTFTGMSAISAGVWHHIVVVIRDVDDISLYLTGCEESGAFDQIADLIAYGDGTGSLGRANALLTSPENSLLRGRLDDFRYWDRALSREEVNELYDFFYSPPITLGNDTMICIGETLLLEPQTTLPAWTWNDGSMAPTFEVSETGAYSVSAETDDCQTVRDTIEVMVGFCDMCEPQIPNAFSPNGDGSNDSFRVLFDLDKCRIIDAQVMIFNRWGQMVFEANTVEERWDGRFNSKDMPSDVYFYFVRYAYESEEGRIEREVKGDLTLIR